MPNRTCTVPGCENAPRSRKADWCPKHYHRWYRHGSVHRVDRGQISVSPGRRYRTVTAKGHPLAGANGRIYEHRLVLFDVLGYGPHLCHWCETPVHWVPRGTPGALCVDHLNGIGDDNRPENLAPTCNPCNTTRGMQARADALRAAGWWSHNDTIANLVDGRRERIEAP